MAKTEPEPLEDLGIGTWCLALALGIFARSYLSKVRNIFCLLFGGVRMYIHRRVGCC